MNKCEHLNINFINYDEQHNVCWETICRDCGEQVDSSILEAQEEGFSWKNSK